MSHSSMHFIIVNRGDFIDRLLSKLVSTDRTFVNVGNFIFQCYDQFLILFKLLKCSQLEQDQLNVARLTPE